MLWSTFFQNLALFWVKNADFFAKFFGENILKIITSVPGVDVGMYVCNDQKFLRFLPIFGEKNWRFSQTPMLWPYFYKKTSSSLSKKTPIFSENFSSKNFLNHNIGPWQWHFDAGWISQFSIAHNLSASLCTFYLHTLTQNGCSKAEQIAYLHRRFIRFGRTFSSIRQKMIGFFETVGKY
jgi:hypothetical protein